MNEIFRLVTASAVGLVAAAPALGLAQEYSTRPARAVVAFSPDGRMRPQMTVEGFFDVDDAIALANDTEFELSASIWTHRADQGFKLARSTEAGGISVYASAEAAKQSGPVLESSRCFEPRKQSGYGVDGGVPVFLAYTSAQPVAFFN